MHITAANSVYPGQHNPGLIKCFIEDTIKDSLPVSPPFTTSARDVFIGSVHRFFKFKEKEYNTSTLEEVSEISDIDRGYSATLTFNVKNGRLTDMINSSPADIARLLTDAYTPLLRPIESEDESVDIIVFFKVPDHILSKYKLLPANIFITVKVNTSDNLIKCLVEYENGILENMAHLGFDEEELKQVSMHWCIWSEIASVIAN